MFLIMVISTLELASANKADHKYCKELGRAVEDFCSYDVAQKKCSNMCKDGKSPKLECGKNLHTRKWMELVANYIQSGVNVAMKFAKKTKETFQAAATWVLGGWWKSNEGKEGKRSKKATTGTQKSRSFVNRKMSRHVTQASKRVVHGERSRQGEWPWHLTYRNYPNKSSPYPGARWCDATILTENFALTTAHCFDKGIETLVKHTNFSAEHFKVVAGDYDTEKKEEFETEIQEEKLYHHPLLKSSNIYNESYYNGEWNIVFHDITLMKLAQPIKLEEKNKEQVCIPKSFVYEEWKDKTCYSYGYGFTEDKKQAIYLKEVQLPLVSLEDCNAPQAYNNTIEGDNFCAGFFDIGKTVCNGDSGASLVCKSGGDDARWFQLGMVSSGKFWDWDFHAEVQKDIPCTKHDGDYGISADVVQNIDWILKTILESE